MKSKINDRSIEKVDHYTYLYLIIDDDKSWNKYHQETQ